MRREAQVAGYFYPKGREELLEIIRRFVQRVENPIYARGCISPHAGYIYSGYVAGRVFSSIVIPERVIILGPNHRGLGHPCAIYSKGSWITPLGETKIDKELSEEILRYSKYLKNDPSAHFLEHSLEVQLPFLQYINPLVKIVPITISDYSLKILEDLSSAIFNAVKDKEDIFIIASSDFSHYEPHEIAKEKDSYAISAILNLDPIEFYERVRREDISICGVGPIFVLLSVMKNLGVENSKLIEYKTSGDVTKDYSEVVGYAGIIFF